MKKTVLWVIFSFFLIHFFISNSFGRDLQEACNLEYGNCTSSCIQRYSRATYDIWGRWIGESDITRENKEKCKSYCQVGLNNCMNRVSNRQIEEQKNHFQEIQEDTPTEYPLSSSNSSIYVWKDTNGVIHITNQVESIPPEYREQYEQQANGKEIQSVKGKINTKSANTAFNCSPDEPKGQLTDNIPRVVDELGKTHLLGSLGGPTLYAVTVIAGVIIGLKLIVIGRRKK
jgi:hypothetical protein